MVSWMLWARLAEACPAELVNREAVESGAPVTVGSDVASMAAPPGKLLGSSCLYSTGLMARRVMEEGSGWTWEGQLAPMVGNMDAPVSCPFTVADGSLNVIANGLLDAVVSCGYAEKALVLEGRSLDLDGVRYVVLTSFRIQK
jgi:hypothetical protein